MGAKAKTGFRKAIRSDFEKAIELGIAMFLLKFCLIKPKVQPRVEFYWQLH